MILTRSKFKKIIFWITVGCIVINFLVKLGLIFGWNCAELLVIGAVIDMLGVLLITWVARYLN
jgi:hypothetical protein